VKITGAHDFNDYAAAQRHQLPLIVVMTLDAKINENGPKQFQGMDRYVARKAVVAALEKGNYLAGVDKKHRMVLPKSARSGAVVEPMLTDQWWVKMAGMAKDGLEVVKRGEVRFIPEHWTATYNNWLENLEDWNISRQLCGATRSPPGTTRKGRFTSRMTKKPP